MFPFYPQKSFSHLLIVFCIIIASAGFLMPTLVNSFGMNRYYLMLWDYGSLGIQILLFQFLHGSILHLLVFCDFNNIRCYSTSHISATYEYNRYIRILYGAPLISLDRSLYYPTSDGISDSRDARYQYWYMTRSRYIPRWTLILSYMGTHLVGNIQRLEKIVFLDYYFGKIIFFFYTYSFAWYHTELILVSCKIDTNLIAWSNHCFFSIFLIADSFHPFVHKI